MKCSILMVIGLYHPAVGGAERVCHALARSLSARDIPVTVLTQHVPGLPGFEVIDGVPVYRHMQWWHPFGIAYMLSVLWFLVRQRHRYDIIQCFGLFLFIPPAIIMRYLFKKKVVVRLLCSGFYGDFAGLEQLTLKGLITACAKRCDSIVSLSKDITGELLGNHFPASRVVSIPNGVDCEHFTPHAAEKGVRSGTICYVGRLEVQKGLVYLLRALAIIVAQGCTAKLSIVGDGSQRGTLEELAKHLDINGHVVFAGLQEDVLSYYQHARTFVLPSLAEGMSSSLLEAMACGLPVITSRVGGVEELIGAEPGEKGLPRGHYCIGKRGILVNPRDENGLAASISALLQDDSLSRTLGMHARAFVHKDYSLKTVAGSYQDLYSRLGR